MRLRPVLLALTAAAAFAGSVPAEAAIYPVCTTRLALVATGASASCSTNPAPVAFQPALRLMTVEVLSGSVDAVLKCGTYARPPIHVSGPRPVTVSLNENGQTCTVTITAADYDTTAVVTSTFASAIYA